MSGDKFDYDQWSDDLRALAVASDLASRAWLDQMDDKRLQNEFEDATDRFREAHRGWLRDHPDRIPGLIAHRRRERRRRRSHSYGVADERMREWELNEIKELWTLHLEARSDGSQADDYESAPEPAAPPAFTVQVSSTSDSFRRGLFGAFETLDEAQRQADQWQRDARAAGVFRLFIGAAAIEDVSAYHQWVEPEFRRVTEQRVEQELAAERTRLLLEFHDAEAILELGAEMIADAVRQTGQFEIVCIDDAVDSYRRAAAEAGRSLGRQLAVTTRAAADGTQVTAVVKTNIDLANFRAAHGRNPMGPGTWRLRNTESGEEITRSGKWGEVRANIPGGDWTLLPRREVGSSDFDGV